jgi:hypothetical protein
MEHQSSRLVGRPIAHSLRCQDPSEVPHCTPIHGFLLCFQKFDASRGEGHDGFEEDGGAGVVFC